MVQHRLSPYAVLGVLGCLALAGCGPKAKTAAPAAPATTQTLAHETELLRLTLTPDAERRLGLQTTTARSGSARRVRSTHGEIVPAPGAGGLPAAPGADLATLAGNQAASDGAWARARAEVAVANQAFTRAEGLLRDEAGSVRARDEAAAALGVARANLAMAQSQRALLGPGVNGLSSQTALWVRVTALSSDLAQLDLGAAAQVRDLNGAGGGRAARPVRTPPTGNAALGTVDLFYALPSGAGLRIGQRVAVDLAMRGADSGLSVPASAILRDIYGGEWVYVRTGDHAYERRRVEVGATQGGRVMLTRGPASGAAVVTAGAAELFGAEFGAK